MPIEVKMAKLSPTMESGQLVSWQVKVGDTVKEGDTLAEVQTDKAVMPLESFEDGTVALLDVDEGAEIALGQRILVLAEQGEDPGQIATDMKGATSAEATQAQPAADASNSAPAAAIAAHSANGSNGSTSTGSLGSVATAPAPSSTERVRSTPLARKIAAHHEIDIRLIPGTGPNGRIHRRDVEAYLQSAPAQASTPATPAQAIAQLEPERIPMSRMRQTIAARMAQAKREAPEIHLTIEVRVDQILQIRQRLNDRLSKQGVKLSVSDFVTKAVAMALVKHPDVNSWLEDNGQTIVRHHQANIGIAVALETGLIVPVLHGVERLGLREIREGTKTIVEAARANKLHGEQLAGGTFTISNMGMYGIKVFDAILNLPQVAILAVGAATKQPIVENDQLTIGTVMNLTLTADHRVIDGAVAAEFMQTLHGFLEDPATMLL